MTAISFSELNFKEDRNMEKKVSYDEYRIEMETFRRKIYELSDGGIEVYSMQTWGDSKAPIELGINWYACGTQTLEKTEEFLHSLKMLFILFKMRSSALQKITSFMNSKGVWSHLLKVIEIFDA
jgi:hypothetical protein